METIHLLLRLVPSRENIMDIVWFLQIVSCQGHVLMAKPQKKRNRADRFAILKDFYAFIRPLRVCTLCLKLVEFRTQKESYMCEIFLKIYLRRN